VENFSILCRLPWDLDLDGNERMTESVTSGTPDRAWYSVSSKGLLEAAKFVKDFSAEIGGTLKNLGTSFWPDFKVTDILR
jgi:hypothetical protein